MAVAYCRERGLPVPELEGQLRTAQELRDLLLDLEARRRTGTPRTGGVR